MSPPPLLVLDAVPTRSFRGLNHRRYNLAGRLRRYRATTSSMDAVEGSSDSSVTPRLPSTKPIDERWDRPRCLILRNAEQNALRDFRWTQDEPITFAHVPASSRSYARRELTRRSDSESTPTRMVQGGLVDRPEQVTVSTQDRLTQELKQSKVELSRAEDEVS